MDARSEHLTGTTFSAAQVWFDELMVHLTENGVMEAARVLRVAVH